MIKVKINEDVYHVRFKYQIKDKKGKTFFGKFYLSNNGSVITSCEILRIDEAMKNLDLRYAIVGVGEAKKNKSDILDKGFARRLSLTRAIANIKKFDYNLGDRLANSIWPVYFSTTKDGKLIKG